MMTLFKKLVQKAISIAVLFFVPVFGLSQELPRIILPSPSTQLFEKYGNFPPGPFNGIPDIDIPLYTIKEGDLTVPISLKYYAEGFKPSAPNGFVGMNWTLMAGGKISRTVMGNRDDGMPPPNPFYTMAELSSMVRWQRDQLFDYWQTYYDTEPDIFSYNFNGHSGQFVLKRDAGRTPLLLPYKPIQITSGLGSGTALNSFHAIDEHGIQYTFNASEFNDNTAGVEIMAWDVSSMTSATDPTNTINFVSGGGASEFAVNRSDTYTIDDTWETPTGLFRACYPLPAETKSFDEVLLHYNSNPADGWDTFYNKIQKTGATTSITFKGGSLTFIPLPVAPYRLQEIQIKDRTGRLLKTIGFFYEDIPGGDIRYLLKKVDFYDSQHNLIYNYKFDYNSPSNVDSYNASTDYWGYYNGSVPNQYGMLPYLNIHLNPGNRNPIAVGSQNNRLINEFYTKLFMLNKITYPSGGYTTYDYESNQYPYYIPALGGLHQVGGLRVKTISNHKDPDATPETHTYVYGGEQIDFAPGNLEDYSYSIQGMIPFPGSSTWNTYRERFYSSEASFNLCPHGSPVVYTYVTEFTGDGTTNNGKTLYFYDYTPATKTTYESNGYYDLDGNPIIYKQYLAPFQSWTSGNLISTTHYKIVSGTDILVSSHENTYVDIPRDTLRGFVLSRYLNYTYDGCTELGSNAEFNNINLDGIGVGSINSAFNYGDYSIVSGYRRLANTTDYISGVTTITNYEYANAIHDQPTKKTVTTSRGDQLITLYKYPHDYASVSPVYSDMVNNRHMWAPVVEQTSYKNSLSSTPLQSLRTNYDYWAGTGTASNILPKYIESQTGNNGYESRIRFYNYDDQGNVLNVAKENGPKIVYLYSYGGSYPIAQIMNADYTTVENILGGSAGVKAFRDNPAPTEAAVNSFLAPLRNPALLPNTQVSTYTYTPLVGMTSATDPKGQTAYYEYDSFQRLKTVKDQNGKMLKLNDYHYKP